MTYVDRMGVERHRHNGRKVRKDKGVSRPHPVGCAHCKMVQEYRDARDADIERQGGFRNENARGRYTFKEWLVMYYRNERQQLREIA